MDIRRLLSVVGFISCLAVSLLTARAQSATQQKQDDKTSQEIYVYVTDSQSWEMRGGWGVSGSQNANGSRSIAGGGYEAGGARPQTAEIIKTFNQRCPEVTVTNNVQKADFAVTLDHEGGKGYLRHRNKLVVFNRDGDAIFSDSTRELGNSVKDACNAILSAPPRSQQAASPNQQIQPTAPPSTASTSAANQPQTNAGAEIEVTSTPSGADIELDGSFVGNTPSTIGVPPGDHAIAIKKNGYKPWERKMKVSSGKINISAELETATDTRKESDESRDKIEAARSPVAATPQKPAQGAATAGAPEAVGSVLVTSDPSGADVYVDDAPVGKTPATLRLKPGQHYMRMFMKDYNNWSQQIMVETSSETRLTVTLVKSN